MGAIRRNVAALLSWGNTPIAAVVKANAYGHGAVPVAHAALEAGAAWLAVVSVDEALALRAAGLDAPVLVMSYIDPSDAARVVAGQLTPTVATAALAEALSAEVVRLGGRSRYNVHVKVDTGLHRYGIARQEAEAFIRWVNSLPGLQVSGLYTHLATADEADKSFARRQIARFAEIAAEFPEIRLRHAANSAGLIDLPEARFDLARVGIALYGIYPSDAVSHDLPLDSVLSLKARVARVHALAAGESVSYGCTWTAGQPARVALIPCGYGDGWARAHSNRGHVLIRGRPAPIRGIVCMDHFVVETTAIPEVQEGDEAVLIGRQADATRSAAEVAAEIGTIPYEVVTAISARVPRIYLA